MTQDLRKVLFVGVGILGIAAALQMGLASVGLPSSPPPPPPPPPPTVPTGAVILDGSYSEMSTYNNGCSAGSGSGYTARAAGATSYLMGYSVTPAVVKIRVEMQSQRVLVSDPYLIEGSPGFAERLSSPYVYLDLIKSFGCSARAGFRAVSQHSARDIRGNTFMHSTSSTTRP
jgi:hypothetical protein